MSKYIVPEGMLKAAVRVGPHGCESEIKRIIEAALLWLSENPIVPTPDQMDGCCDDIKGAKSLMMNVHEIAIHCSVEWQRRMFVTPEPEVGQAAKRVMQNMMGCTFTPAEADAILKQLGYAAHGWSVPSKEDCPSCANGQSLERGEGTHREGTKQHPAEPEVLEEIKDLMWRINNPQDKNDDRVCGDHNLNVIEAYHRGKESSKR